ncbi:hemerythrin domain-containing protein [Embleya sp. AB8]|uniref:hemerythrin domain-containing protein n=1 Tax=Embleya sp. AB8 TaxID=3156304 RepID=UPI003C752BD6
MSSSTNADADADVVAAHPYTREMVMIHRIFRRESRLTAELVREVRPGDGRRAAVLAGAWATYSFGVHLHHAGEDELIWPLLMARVDLDAEQVLRMQLQHAELHASLDRVARLMDRWSADPAEATRDDLARTLDEHHRMLCDHLDEEERQVMPLVIGHLTADEWRVVGERGLAETPRNRRLLALGAILEDASPDERAEFLGRLPAPARLVWRVVGRRRYAREVRRIRGVG